MKKVKIVLDLSTCISCGSCIPEADKYFEETPEGNIHLIGSTLTDEIETLITEVTDEELKALKSAVDICPVEAIKVTEIKE